MFREQRRKPIKNKAVIVKKSAGSGSVETREANVRRDKNKKTLK